jgi:hypothetical protein
MSRTSTFAVASRVADASNLTFTRSAWLSPHEIADAICKEPSMRSGDLYGRVRMAQVFDFGVVPDATIRRESVRAAPLLVDGYLDIPFDTVLFRYRFVPEVRVTETFRNEFPDVADWAEFLNQMHDFQNFETLVIRRGEREWDVCDFVQLVPAMLGALDLRIPAGVRAFEPVSAARIRAIRLPDGTPGFESSRSWMPMQNPTPNAEKAMAAGLADTIAAFCLIANARGVPQEYVPAPRKLNVKRERAGNPPLPAVTFIRTEVYCAAAHNTDRGGTHASPVPHLRRGHRRTLASGRVTWVRDTVVNCRSREEAAASRDHYEVVPPPRAP